MKQSLGCCIEAWAGVGKPHSTVSWRDWRRIMKLQRHRTWAAKDKRQWDGRLAQKTEDGLCGRGLGYFELISKNIKDNGSQVSNYQRRYVQRNQGKRID